jgi:hypothetical protein
MSFQDMLRRGLIVRVTPFGLGAYADQLNWRDVLSSCTIDTHTPSCATSAGSRLKLFRCTQVIPRHFGATMNRRHPTRLVAALLAFGLSISCETNSPPKKNANQAQPQSQQAGAHDASTSSPQAAQDSNQKSEWNYGEIIYQPHFSHEDAPDSYNGTAFLTRGPGGTVFGVGSAHYILGGSVAHRIELLEIASGEAIIDTDKSYGPVGDGDPTTPPENSASLAEDFFFVPVETEVVDENIVELDAREYVKKGERIWFPNKNPDADKGYTLFEGTVIEVDSGYVGVEMDTAIPLQSQSGTPFVSQHTGKAIGTLATARTQGTDTVVIYLAPAHAIRQGLASNREIMPLSAAIMAENGEPTR